MTKTNMKITSINSCWECATKHVCMARTQYDEYRQDNDANVMDLINCIGNLGCCETHIIDERPDLASLCREVRKAIMKDNFVDITMFDTLVTAVCGESKLFEKTVDKKSKKV